MKKRLTCVILACFLILALFPLLASAQSSADQITAEGRARYYNKDGAEVTTTPVLGQNAVVSVEKKIEGTDKENEFIMTLDVKTSVDIEDVEVSTDAAAVLVLDISGSMSSPVNYMPALKTAAQNFLDSFAKSNDDAKRYVSLVSFATNATIRMGWIDISVPANLTAMKSAISGLTAGGSTNMEGGLQLARNLMRTQGFPVGRDDLPIANRNVVLFSDGEANTWATNTYNGGTAIGNPAHNSTEAGNFAGTTVYGGAQYTTGVNYSNVLNYTVNMAGAVKSGSSFSAGGTEYPKYDANLFTIAFGSSAPTTWLRNNIASNTTFAYSADNASELNKVFESISETIIRWAEAWIVTDPMGPNIEFISTIAQNDLDTGLLKLDNGTLNWDLKKAYPKSVQGDVYTYIYVYRIKLDTTKPGYAADTLYPTNGETDLTYVMVTNGQITSNVMQADFAVPTVKGYAGGLSFTKVGGDDANLAGCEFLLTNRADAGHEYSQTSTSAGAVSFANIPSGQTYQLKEVSMPAALQDGYIMSDEVYTVTVSYGVTTVKDSKGNTVSSGGFKFVNPLAAEVHTGDPDPNTLGPNGVVIRNNTYTGVVGTVDYVAVRYSTYASMLFHTTTPGAAVGTPYDVVLTGLTPGTTYYYRAVVYTGGGELLGEIKSFTTPAAPIKQYVYYVDYYIDTLNKDPDRTIRYAAVPEGTVVTLTEAQLNAYRPAGYQTGKQVDGPVAITQPGQIIRVLYDELKTDIPYTVNYYKDSKNGELWKTETGTGTFGDPIPANLDAPPAGYLAPGDRSGPATIGENAADNVVSVVFSKELKPRVWYVEYYLETDRPTPSLVGRIRMPSVEHGTVATLTQAQLNAFKPSFALSGVQIDGPVAIEQNGQIVKVLYGTP